MKKIPMIFLSVLVVAALAACAPGSNVSLDKNNSQMLFTMPGANPELGKPVEGGSVAGLGTGLFHGLISIVTLIISFFNPEIQMYEVHNTGPLYNLGFLIGAVVLFALLGFSGGRRR